LYDGAILRLQSQAQEPDGKGLSRSNQFRVCNAMFAVHDCYFVRQLACSPFDHFGNGDSFP
jgi:hypothetical protein